jgi:hypothetical protein
VIRTKDGKPFLAYPSEERLVQENRRRRAQPAGGGEQAFGESERLEACVASPRPGAFPTLGSD